MSRGDRCHSVNKYLKWRWVGYIARLKDIRRNWKLLEWGPRENKCNRGGPPTRWTVDIKKATTNWLQRAYGRQECHRIGELFVQQSTSMAG